MADQNADAGTGEEGAQRPPEAPAPTERAVIKADDVPLPAGPMRVTPRGAGGGRLNRSETVTVRLDPELNYLCELASRAQRRTKSSFIEWAVQNALREVLVPGTGRPDLEPHSIARLGPDLWDVDEPDRLVRLAFNAPSLLTHEEQVIWKFIRENGGMWLGGFAAWNDEAWTWVVKPESVNWEKLRENWSRFKAAASTGELSILPPWNRHRPDNTSLFDEDLDSDLPF